MSAAIVRSVSLANSAQARSALCLGRGGLCCRPWYILEQYLGTSYILSDSIAYLLIHY